MFASRVMLARAVYHLGRGLRTLFSLLLERVGLIRDGRPVSSTWLVVSACGGYMAARAACVAATSIWPMPVGSFSLFIAGARLVLVAIVVLVVISAVLVRRQFSSNP
jgi:hypothetical protein